MISWYTSVFSLLLGERPETVTVVYLLVICTQFFTFSVWLDNKLNSKNRS